MAEMVYITELDTGTRVALPLPPEAVKCKAETKFVTWNIIRKGEVKLPDGEKLVKFSWSGRLPGESMKGMNIVSSADWRSPKEIQSIFSVWRSKGTKLRLLVTGTTINHDVYLDSYSVDNSKLDTVEYSIAFSVAKDIKVYTVTELGISTTAAATTTNDRAASTEGVSDTPQATTYTVAKGDCLWNIAKKFLGDGSRYTEIYAANKSIIGSNPSLIYPGQILTIPS